MLDWLKKLLSKATPAEDFKRRAYREFTGPSGFTYVLRRIDPFKFVALLGEIPSMGPSGLDAMTDEERQQHIIKVLQQQGGSKTVEQIDAMVAEALVKPKIGEGDDEIAFEDIPLEDLLGMIELIADMAGAGEAAKKSLGPT